MYIIEDVTPAYCKNKKKRKKEIVIYKLFNGKRILLNKDIVGHNINESLIRKSIITIIYSTEIKLQRELGKLQPLQQETDAIFEYDKKNTFVGVNLLEKVI